MTDGRGLPTTFKNAAAATQNRPTWLVAVHTGTSPAVLRYSNLSRDIDFPDGGDTYEASGFQLGVVTVDIHSAAHSVLILGDDGTIVGLGVADWGDKKIEIIRIERDETSDTTYAQRDVFLVDSGYPSQGRFTFDMSHRRSRLEDEIPRDLVDYERFPGVRDARY